MQAKHLRVFDPPARGTGTMTEAKIILLMVKCVPIILAVWIFCHLLCDEYLRALEIRGLIRRPPDTVMTDKTPKEGSKDTEEKPG